MKRVALTAVFGALSLACAGPGTSGSSSSSSSGGSTSSSSSSGGVSSSAGNASTSGGNSSTTGTSGNSGNASSDMGPLPPPVGTPAEACAMAPTLNAGANQGSTVGRKDGLTGCTVDSLFGSYVVGQDSREQVWSLNLTEAAGIQLDLTADFDGSFYIRKGADCATATLETQGCVDSGVTGDPETGTIRLLQPGQYWVVVEAYGEGDEGAYTLTLTRTPGGICIPDGVDDPSNMPSRANDTLATAFGPVGTQTDDMDMPADATLSLCGADQDWFTFFTSGGDVTLHVVPEMGAAGALTAEVQSITRPAAGGAPMAGMAVNAALTNGSITMPALAGGEYAVKVAATGLATAGMEYGFNVLFTCTPDGTEIRTGGMPSGNNTAPMASGPYGSIPTASAKTASLCPTDVDYLWVANAGAMGDVVVTLAGAGALTVEAFLATVVDGKVTAEGGSANAMITTAGTGGADKVVTFTGAATGAQFLVKVSAGMTPPAAAGVPYTVAITAPPPANDTCAAAQAVTLPAVGAAALHVAGTTQGATDNLAATTAMCTSLSMTATPPDVFYAFTAPATAVKLKAVTAGEGDTVIYLLKGACAGGMEVACNDDTMSGVLTSTLEATLEANQAYILVVDAYRTGSAFDLALSTSAP